MYFLQTLTHTFVRMRVNVPLPPLSLMFFCSVQPIYCYFLVPAAPHFFLPRPYSLSAPPFSAVSQFARLSSTLSFLLRTSPPLQPLRFLHYPFLCDIQTQLQSVSPNARSPSSVSRDFRLSSKQPPRLFFPRPNSRSNLVALSAPIFHPALTNTLLACLSSIPIIYPARYLHIIDESIRVGLALIYIAFFPPKVQPSLSHLCLHFLNLK